MRQWRRRSCRCGDDLAAEHSQLRCDLGCFALLTLGHKLAARPETRSSRLREPVFPRATRGMHAASATRLLPSQELCDTAHKRWTLQAAAIAHRVGEVRVGEASVMIAISSAHRREALEARCCPATCQVDCVLALRAAERGSWPVCWQLAGCVGGCGGRHGAQTYTQWHLVSSQGCATAAAKVASAHRLALSCAPAGPDLENDSAQSFALTGSAGRGEMVGRGSVHFVPFGQCEQTLRVCKATRLPSGRHHVSLAACCGRRPAHGLTMSPL